MSDIRFEGWLHRSGTGGVYQDSAGNVGIASTQPQQKLDIGNGGFKVGPTGIATITTVNTTNLINATPLSHRNVIINGAAMVAQRGTSTTGATSGGYATDRFQAVQNETGTITISQDADAPTGSGFRQCHKLIQTTAQGSLAANDLTTFRYNAEGFDLQRFKKGTSSAEEFTVSFWVKTVDQSSYPVTYILELRDPVNTRSCCKSYTVNTSNTWEYKTITFPADTSGQWATDNSKSLEMNWFVAAGSNYTSGTLSTSWATTVTANRAPGLTANLSASTSNRFSLTGVQLEVGSQATPFEHRSYCEELARCQRYYYRITGNDNDTAGLGFAISSNENYFWIELPVPMRAYPTYSGSATAARFFSGNNGQDFNLSSLSISTPTTHANPTKAFLYVTAGGTSTGYGGALSFQADNGIMEFSAEL